MGGHDADLLIHNGRIATEDDRRSMAEQIQRLVDDPALAERLGQRGYLFSVGGDVPSMRDHTLTVEAVYRAFGFDPEITDTASNHTSAALRAGIPAAGMGTAPCEGSHGLNENCEIEPIFKGIKRMIVLATALSE